MSDTQDQARDEATREALAREDSIRQIATRIYCNLPANIITHDSYTPEYFIERVFLCAESFHDYAVSRLKEIEQPEAVQNDEPPKTAAEIDTEWRKLTCLQLGFEGPVLAALNLAELSDAGRIDDFVKGGGDLTTLKHIGDSSKKLVLNAVEEAKPSDEEPVAK